MKLPITSSGARAFGARVALTAALVAGGVAMAPRIGSNPAQAAFPPTSTKPDWRGADLGNTGRLSSSGPAALPSQVFNAHPETFGNSYGIELDGAGNIIYGTGTGHVYSFSPSGTQNWLATLATTEGSDLAGPPSHPVASSDGNIYIGGDNGNLYQINALSGAVSTIFGTASSKALLQTPKIGADNTLYVGAADGNLYHLSPSSGSSTTLYTFAASGSTQTSGAAAGLTSVAPFVFYGETAVDAAGNAYAVSTDSDPSLGTPTLGTVYKISPAGALVWKKPVQGAAPGAVVLAANPAAPGQTLVIVANRTPQVNAFDAATGALVWTFVPASNTPIAASPALSPDGSTLYIDNNADTLYALNVSTGALNTSFNGTGSVAVGSNVSPIVDAAGNVYIESSNGALQGYSPAGAQLFTIPGGSGAGQSGAANGGYMSPAISANGTIYGGGNKATVRGFQAASTSTSTSTPAPTGTPTTRPSATPSATPMPAAVISVSPTTGVPFQTVTVSGARFLPNEPVRLFWDKSSGTVLTTTTTSAQGSFAAIVRVPETPNGRHTILAYGLRSARTASVGFQVVPRLILTPATAPVGGRVVTSGFGFAAGEKVTVYLASPATGLGSSVASPLGSFSGSTAVTFTVPVGTAPGPHTVVGVGQTSRAAAQATLTVR